MVPPLPLTSLKLKSIRNIYILYPDLSSVCLQVVEITVTVSEIHGRPGRSNCLKVIWSVIW